MANDPYDLETAAAELLDALTTGEREGACIGTIAEGALRGAYAAGVQHAMAALEDVGTVGTAAARLGICGNAEHVERLRAEIECSPRIERAAPEELDNLRAEIARWRATAERGDDTLDALAVVIARGGPIRCEQCGRPATCVGAYETDEPALACDECCAHGNEDGWCERLGHAGKETSDAE